METNIEEENQTEHKAHLPGGTPAPAGSFCKRLATWKPTSKRKTKQSTKPTCREAHILHDILPSEVRELVEVKGWRNGLLVTLPDTLELDELLAAIRERLEQGRNLELWRGSVATIDFGARIVLPDALDSIVGVLKDSYGILPTAIISEIPETRAAADRLTLTIYDVLPTVVMPPVGQAPEPEKPPQLGQGNALYIPHTVRSGQRILHNGAVIVNGDVNPGSEVISAGDIVVLGTLRGVAHAGANGDESSRIFARSLRPPQLRIASLYARAPESDGKTAATKGAECARVQSGAIDIIPW